MGQLNPCDSEFRLQHQINARVPVFLENTDITLVHDRMSQRRGEALLFHCKPPPEASRREAEWGTGPRQERGRRRPHAP